MNEVEQFCERHGACQKGREWATQYQTLAEVWGNCQRADWMLWILERLSDELNQTAIAVAERFSTGNATASELSSAGLAAWNALRNAKTALWVYESDQLRKMIPNPFSTPLLSEG
jgi:hypothetical protein